MRGLLYLSLFITLISCKTVCTGQVSQIALHPQEPMIPYFEDPEYLSQTDRDNWTSFILEYELYLKKIGIYKEALLR